MPKNLETLNSSLFELLRSRGYEPTMLGTDGKEIPVPEEADVFQFKFIKDGEDYGPVTLSIDGTHKLIVYFGDNIANSPSEEMHNGDTSWYTLLNHLKRFSHQHQLSFEVKNTDHLKYDMAKRTHMKKIDEGYYATGKKSSYSDAVPDVKIILQHNRQLEEGERRYRAVERIFVENASGERFAIPTNKPGLARVYARHIAEGGTPYDEQGKHITSLCEEYSKMAGFVRATRNGQFNESTQSLVNEGVNHYQKLRETLHKMTGSRGYNAYFESWAPALMEDEDTTDLSEMFASTALDPRIESVMPILRKLNKTLAEMVETTDLGKWADDIIEESLGEELDEVSAAAMGRAAEREFSDTGSRPQQTVAPQSTRPWTLVVDGKVIGTDKNVAVLRAMQQKRGGKIIRQGAMAEGVSLKQKHEDKKRADQNQVRYGKMTQAEFDKKWTRTERPKPTDKEQGVAEAVRVPYYGSKGLRAPQNQAERDSLATDVKANRAANKANTEVSGYGNKIAPQFGVDSSARGGARNAVHTNKDSGQEVATNYQSRNFDPKHVDISGNLKLRRSGKGVAEGDKNPHTSALGKALYRDLSKEKKASPQQVQRNKERWARLQADKEQGVAEGSLNEISQDTAVSYAGKRMNTDTTGKSSEKIEKMIKGLKGALARAHGEKPTSPSKKKEQGVAEGLPKAQDGRYNPDGSKKKQWHQDPRWQQHAKDRENDPKNIYGGLGKKKGVAESDGLESNNPQGIPEGRMTHGPGGVPLDRRGNSIPSKEVAPKVPTGPRVNRDRNGLTKEDYSKVWRKIEEVVGNIFPDGDPIDYMGPWLARSGIKDYHVGEVLDKACKMNGYEDMYAYYNSFKTDDYGFNEGLDANQIAAGQAGPNDKAPLRGKLVGANESVDPLDRLKFLLK